MDAKTKQIGDRIRGLLPAAGMSQGELARRIHMAPDALSRAMNGKRGFSVDELTGIGGALGQSLHWLVTGRPDPFALRIAARQAYDPVTHQRSNPGADTDEPIVSQVPRAYRQAYPAGPPATPELPHDAATIRGRLGERFVREFSERVEKQIGVDVVSVPRLSTAYSLSIGPRKVIVLPTEQYWFRRNWSLAHELGHLALGHHQDESVEGDEQENAADHFASELLLPKDLIRSRDWSSMTGADVARFLWETEVSALSLRTRLNYLHVARSEGVDDALDITTPKLLRAHPDMIGDGASGAVAIGRRQQEATARRWPADLVARLTDRVESGDADPLVLADVLDVDVDEIEFPEPPTEEEVAARYREAVGGPPSAAELDEWFENRK